MDAKKTKIARKDLMRMVRRGLGLSAIAREFGVDRRTVKRAASAYGIDLPSAGFGVKGVPTARYAECADAGMTIMDTARALRVSHTTVLRVARNHGIRFRPYLNQGRCERDYAECAEAGMTVREASKRLGITPGCVRKQAKKFGLVFRRVQGKGAR